MDGLAIGEIARHSGLQPSALRYYESLGLLPAPRRVNGRRVYDLAIVERIKVIQLAKHAGFSIAEIGTLLHGFSPETPPAARWKLLAQAKLTEIAVQQERLHQMRQILQQSLQCGCLRLEDCAKQLEQ